MKNKYIRGLALGMAAMTAFTFTTPQTSLITAQAAAATKATKGTSKITANKKTVKVTAGKTATVKLTLNKKQAKNLKITLKSKNAKIAKPTKSSVVVKKNKKAITFKVKGVKKGNTKITASFKTSKGKVKKATITVKVAAKVVALTGVKLNIKTPKVGDTLKATITPSNATSVKYTWYMGDTAKTATTVISGQTKKTLVVTDDMAGKFIKVTAKGKSGTKSATTTAAVEAKTTPTPDQPKPGEDVVVPTGDVVVPTGDIAKVAVTGVSLSTTAPKVGDTVTATVTPENASNVKYAWYLGNSSNGLTDIISGETAKEIKITKEMVGKYLGVVVSGDDNSSANAATAVAIQEADSTNVAILSAEQTGAKTVKVTFSAPVTIDDALSVKKGNNVAAIEGKPDYSGDFMSAVITLADKITATEYEVTLTPKDTKVKATSVKFTGAISELKEIKFLNNYLVMKNNDYDEGYAYAKGFDQFGGTVNLSGLNVTAGVGKFTSYDSDTGKITLTANKNDYLLIKEVPVFIQYQQGNTMITANATLTVSSQAYVNDVEFGEVTKDGTKRPDGRMTLSELKSKKYYVPFTKIQDQYGNDLSADDLEKQRTTTKTLFVIPNENGAYYSTGKFGTINGKVVLWLEGDASSKPGTMALTITGAGGKTFSKDITVDDDPYIDTLSVSYPELYEGQTETDTLEFSAIDQYGQNVDMWDVRPATVQSGSLLQFTDKNGMTGKQTEISVSGNYRFNIVKEDSSKKVYKVTLTSTPSTKAKDTIVFTTTTAGMKVATHTINVGERGVAAKVKTALSGGNTQLTADKYGKDNSFNFNQNVQFEDANGRTMKRSDADYPKFANSLNVKAGTANSYSSYAWTLTNTKVSSGTVKGDSDGKIDYSEGKAGSTLDYYVTLYGINGTDAYVLDDETFRLTFINSSVEDKSYTVSVDGSIYAVVGSDDDAEIKVTATNKNGETYEVAASRISLAVDGDFAKGGENNKIKANLKKDYADNTTGTADVTVFVDGKEIETVKVPYSNVEPKAAKAVLKYWATTDDIAASKIGAGWDADSKDDEFEATSKAKYVLADGKLTITGANALNDKIQAYVEDQYGQVMKNTSFTRDGADIVEGLKVANGSSNRVTILYKNGSVSNKFYLTDKTDSAFTIANLFVESASDLSNAVAAANGNKKADKIIADGTISAATANLTIDSDDELIVAGTIDVSGATIKNDGKLTIEKTGKVSTKNSTITNNGTIKVNAPGTWTSNNDNIVNNGLVNGDGHVTVDGGTISSNDATKKYGGTWALTGQTLELKGGVKFNGPQTLSKNVKITGPVNFNEKLVKLEAGTEITVANGGTIDNGTNFVIDNGETVTVDGKEIKGTTTTAQGVKIDSNGKVEEKGFTVSFAEKGDGYNKVVVKTTSGDIISSGGRVPLGCNLEVTVTPESNYKVTSVTINGKSGTSKETVKMNDAATYTFDTSDIKAGSEVSIDIKSEEYGFKVSKVVTNTTSGDITILNEKGVSVESGTIVESGSTLRIQVQSGTLANNGLYWVKSGATTVTNSIAITGNTIDFVMNGFDTIIHAIFR